MHWVWWRGGGGCPELLLFYIPVPCDYYCIYTLKTYPMPVLYWRQTIRERRVRREMMRIVRIMLSSSFNSDSWLQSEIFSPMVIRGSRMRN